MFFFASMSRGIVVEDDGGAKPPVRPRNLARQQPQGTDAGGGIALTPSPVKTCMVFSFGLMTAWSLTQPPIIR